MLGDLRRAERGEDGAAHAHAVDPEREALAFLVVPAVHERDADGERGAGHSEQEAEDDDGREGVVKQSEEHERDHAVCHQHGEHDAPAVASGEDSHRDPHQRAEYDWDRHRERELEVAQVQVRLEGRAERSEHAPGEEADREGGQGEPQRHGV